MCGDRDLIYTLETVCTVAVLAACALAPCFLPVRPCLACCVVCLVADATAAPVVLDYVLPVPARRGECGLHNDMPHALNHQPEGHHDSERIAQAPPGNVFFSARDRDRESLVCKRPWKGGTKAEADHSQ